VIAGDWFLIGSNDGHLYVLDLAAGKKLWECRIGTSIHKSKAG
jgi:outer membrane protein assembly factor BamB